MASDDCYGDYLSPDNRWRLLWWICSTILRQIFFQSSQMWVKDWPKFLLDVCYEYYMTVDEDYCGRYSFRDHRCEWKIGPDKSVYIITLSLCRMLSYVCYEDCMTVDVDYYGGYVPLFVTICQWSSTCVLLGVVVYHWIVVVYYYG